MEYRDRDYQVRAYSSIRSAVAEGHSRILACLPTGGGKGSMAARMMQMSAQKGRSSLFFAAQRELISQISVHLRNFGVPYRTIMAGIEDEYQDAQEHMDSSLCVLAAKDTLWARAYRRKKVELPDADVVHVDECHTSLAKTYSKILDDYERAIVIGWTATPIRSDNKPLGSLYTKLIQAATYRELQANGHLVPLRVFAPNRPDLKGCKVSRGDYAKADLEKRMAKDEMVGSITNEWKKHSAGRSTVLFAAGVHHSIHCRNEFRRLGVSSEHIDGKLSPSEREDILGRTRDGLVQVLCNYGVVTTGVDLPILKYMICARPTKSFGLWRQMGGRVQRPHPGHDHAMIQDHSDNTLAFGYPDEDVEWDIDGEDIAKDHAERKKKKKPDNDPARCVKCHTVYRGPHCPSCGHKPERQGQEVEMTKGELVELERAKANKQATIIDKQKHWDQCIGIAIHKNMKIGAAAHMYREKFGVFPPSAIQNVPRSSQWKMTAREFYGQVVKPAAEQAKREIQESLFG